MITTKQLANYIKGLWLACEAIWWRRCLRWSWFLGQEGGRGRVSSGVIDHAGKVLFS